MRVDNPLIGPLGNLTWIKDRTIRLHMTRRQRGFLQFFNQIAQGLDSGLEVASLEVVGVVCGGGWTSRRLTASLFSQAWRGLIWSPLILTCFYTWAC